MGSTCQMSGGIFKNVFDARENFKHTNYDPFGHPYLFMLPFTATVNQLNQKLFHINDFEKKKGPEGP